VGFVSYGNAGGARSVEQLRQVVIELQMVPIRSAIHIPVDVYIAFMNEKVPVYPFNIPIVGVIGSRNSSMNSSLCQRH